MAQYIYSKFRKKKAHVMDVPVNNGLHDAKSGKLMLMAGGDEEIFNRVKPVLDVLGDKVRYFGKIGSGSICKIVHNCLSFGIQTVVAEGFSLGMKAGIDPEALWWVISQAAVGKGALFHSLIPSVYLPRKFDSAHFSLRLAYKDVALAASLGRKYDVPMSLLNYTQQELMTAMNKGWGDKDALISMLLQEERAGLKDIEPNNVNTNF
jgi:3-hydroxyisobutyrate dehydrogenase